MRDDDANLDGLAVVDREQRVAFVLPDCDDVPQTDPLLDAGQRLARTVRVPPPEEIHRLMGLVRRPEAEPTPCAFLTVASGSRQSRRDRRQSRVQSREPLEETALLFLRGCRLSAADSRRPRTLSEALRSLVPILTEHGSGTSRIVEIWNRAKRRGLRQRACRARRRTIRSRATVAGWDTQPRPQRHDFDPSDRFLFANQALCSMLQTVPAVLQGQQFSCFFVDASRDRVAEASRAVGAVKDAETVPRCYDVVLKADDARLLLVTETLLTQVGTSDALTLRVLRDLTERITSERRQRDLEREVQRSQAFQSLAVLAGGVAHDFNNLLSGVVGNAEFAQLKVPESAPPQLSQSLAEIKAFATEAAQLSRQMLAYAGQRSLAIESLDVNAEIGEALRLLHATIDSRSRLVLDLSDQIPHVAADKYQLRQVVTNLVMNALEAMESQRGSLTLQTTCDKLTLERLEHMGRPPALATGEYVRISVTDTGSGIATDVRERIFEPFFSTKSPGRGMGLAAALGIVRSHRGWLDIEATTGVGTTFRVFWPAAQRSVAPLARSVRPAAGALEERCVLLIDDEPAVRIVTTKLLRELGQRVLVAESGRAGIALLSQHGDSVDLVLLDLTMPEQSGSEVLGELRRVRDDVKVVVTSGYHASDASMLLSTPNVIGFLEKPHTLARLEVILASLPPSSREHDK